MKFNSVNQALRYAYEATSKPICPGSLPSTVPRVQRMNEALYLQEKYMEALTIIRKAENGLPEVNRALLRLLYQGINSQDLQILVYQHLKVDNHRAAELIIRAYCGDKRVGLRELRRSLGCGMLKAVSLRNRCYDALDVIFGQSERTLKMVLADYLKVDVYNGNAVELRS